MRTSNLRLDILVSCGYDKGSQQGKALFGIESEGGENPAALKISKISAGNVDLLNSANRESVGNVHFQGDEFVDVTRVGLARGNLNRGTVFAGEGDKVSFDIDDQIKLVWLHAVQNDGVVAGCFALVGDDVSDINFCRFNKRQRCLSRLKKFGHLYLQVEFE